MILSTFHGLRLLLGIVDFVVYTVLLYLLTFLPHRLMRPFYPKLFRSWCRVFVRALNVDLRLMQQHAQRLPPQYILIANHPSAFEDIGVPALFDVVSLAKYEVQHWPIVGRISRAAGTLYVQRESPDSRRAALDDMVNALAAGKNLAIYPEGGCKGRRLYKLFRFGAFEASMRSGVPILPVFLHYEAQDDFEWQPPHTLPQKMWHFLTTQNNRVNYYVFDPIYPTDFPDKAAFNAHVYALYQGWEKRFLQ